MDITGLAMDLLNLIEHTTGMLDIESNQNQLKQLVELNKMNVNFLIHVPNPFRYIGKVKLKELDVLLPRASHTTDQASTGTQHDDPVVEIKVIYDRLEDARARAGQPEFGQNLIQEIRRLIEQFRGKFRLPTPPAAPRSNVDPNRLNNDGDYVVDLPIAAHPNLILVNKVKENLEEMDRILSSLNKEQILWNGIPNPVTRNTRESSSNQNELMDKLAKMTTDLIKQISEVQGHTDCMEIIQADAEIKIEPYIDGMDDSLKDICDQVVAMYKYKHSLPTIPRSGDQSYTWCGSFHKDIFNGNYDAVDKFLESNEFALTSRITVDGNTVLHVAVKAENQPTVQRLVDLLRERNTLEQTLKKRNKEGKTALYIAAASGNRTIAEKLVRTNERILLDECEKGTNHMLPLFVAAKYDKQDMMNFIYDKMRPYRRENAHCPEENPNDEPAKVRLRQWALFLANLIYNDHYDMASLVIGDYPHLALHVYKYENVETPLFALAQRPSLGANMTFHDKASTFSYPTFICGNKMDDGTASKAFELLDEIILNSKDWESHKSALSAAFFKAAEVGNVGLVAKFIESHRAVLNWLNVDHQNIFHVAIINRQENIFNLIYRLTNSEKSELTGSADKSNNWMLHLAGEIAPANRLNQVPGPAMQLQRELQWFQAVKEIVPNISMDVKNLVINMTPHELFVEKHKDLMKDGEKWMRKTASSGSIVATLITTVVFAAGFTVPGGYKPDSGYPPFIGHISFLFFAAADLVALITSSISVLLFLSILTSRFTEEDFLKSLPMRLFWGLFLLFFSMAAMMYAFCDAIYIIIQEQYHWCIPIIVVAGIIPVFLFFLVMYPLPFDLRRATRNSIFDKSSRHMYY